MDISVCGVIFSGVMRFESQSYCVTRAFTTPLYVYLRHGYSDKYSFAYANCGALSAA